MPYACPWVSCTQMPTSWSSLKATLPPATSSVVSWALLLVSARPDGPVMKTNRGPCDLRRRAMLWSGGRLAAGGFPGGCTGVCLWVGFILCDACPTWILSLPAPLCPTGSRPGETRYSLTLWLQMSSLPNQNCHLGPRYLGWKIPGFCFLEHQYVT